MSHQRELNTGTTGVSCVCMFSSHPMTLTTTPTFVPKATGLNLWRFKNKWLKQTTGSEDERSTSSWIDENHACAYPRCRFPAEPSGCSDTYLRLSHRNEILNLVRHQLGWTRAGAEVAPAPGIMQPRPQATYMHNHTNPFEFIIA